MRRPVRIGIGGPVGSGKTALLVALCRSMGRDHSLAAITNDIYTKEDAEFVIRSGAIAPERVAGVETGGCPHTAIREDVSMNAHAIEEMAALHPDLDIVFVESGGDNLAATFSPELVDSYIYVIDVAEGDKIPRKGGPASPSRRCSSSTRSTSRPSSARPRRDGARFDEDAGRTALHLHQPARRRGTRRGDRLDRARRSPDGRPRWSRAARRYCLIRNGSSASTR